MNIKRKLIWLLLLFNSFLILIINGTIKFKHFKNLMKQYRELLKIKSKYTEDGDYHLIRNRKKNGNGKNKK